MNTKQSDGHEVIATFVASGLSRWKGSHICLWKAPTHTFSHTVWEQTLSVFYHIANNIQISTLLVNSNGKWFPCMMYSFYFSNNKILYVSAILMEIDTSYNQSDREIERLNFYDANTVMFSCIFIVSKVKTMFFVFMRKLTNAITWPFRCHWIPASNRI